GLGGKARAIAISIAAALAVLVAILILVPYPLKMDAKGQLLPKERRYIFSPVEGRIVGFRVDPGQNVYKNDPLVEMYDTELEKKMLQLKGEADISKSKVRAIELQMQDAKSEDRLKLHADKVAEESTYILKMQELEAIRQRVNADPEKFGYFF